MAYYQSLREYLEALDKAGKLITINSPVNKDTQLAPLTYLQRRGLPLSQCKGFFFTNVFDSRGIKYDIPVAQDVLWEFNDIGLQCQPEEVLEKVAQAIMHPIEPQLVKKGPVQEVVYMGGRLLEKGGLDELPVPITHPGWDGAPIMSGSCWRTKDIETGTYNTGTYRCDLYSQTRAGIHIGGVNQDISTHWQKCRARGIPLQVAVVVGGPPNLSYVGVMKLPYGVDEYAVAGAMVGEPVELVKCKTVDLEVPANADFVIEGELSTAERQEEGPHGEVTGLVGMGDLQPFLDVKCITHRQDPIWLGPAEFGLASPGLYKRLRYDLNMPHVLGAASPYSRAPSVLGHQGASITAIKIKNNTDQSEVWRTLEAAGGGGIIVAVDEHIDIKDMDMVLWSIRAKSRPHRDFRIVLSNGPDMHPMDATYMTEPLFQELRRTAFDPEAKMPGDPGMLEGRSYMLINATQKWPFPPLNLPKKEFMEEALCIWQKEGLGPLDLRETWYGCELGVWPQKYAEDAERAVRGEYYKTHEKRFQERVSNAEIPPGDYHRMRVRWLKYPPDRSRDKD